MATIPSPAFATHSHCILPFLFVQTHDYTIHDPPGPPCCTNTPPCHFSSLYATSTLFGPFCKYAQTTLSFPFHIPHTHTCTVFSLFCPFLTSQTLSYTNKTSLASLIYRHTPADPFSSLDTNSSLFPPFSKCTLPIPPITVSKNTILLETHNLVNSVPYTKILGHFLPFPNMHTGLYPLPFLCHTNALSSPFSSLVSISQTLYHPIHDPVWLL